MKKINQTIIIMVYSVLFQDKTTEIRVFDNVQLAGFKRSKRYKTVVNMLKLQELELLIKVKVFVPINK